MYVLAIALLFRHSNTGFEQTNRKIEFRFEEASRIRVRYHLSIYMILIMVYMILIMIHLYS